MKNKLSILGFFGVHFKTRLITHLKVRKDVGECANVISSKFTPS